MVVVVRRAGGGGGGSLYVDGYTSRGADTPLTGTWVGQREERGAGRKREGRGWSDEASGLCH